MSAVYLANLVIHKGTYFEETFALTAEDGLGVNLTNASATARLKKHSTAGVGYTFSTTITVNESTVKISMSNAVTATLPSGRNYYDLIINESNGNKSKVVQGNVIVEETASI